MKKILFFAFVAILLVACKKDDQIKKNLWQGGGIWDIAKIEEKTVNNPGETIDTTRLNAGFAQFNEDGTGRIVLKKGDSTIVEATDFNYYLSKNTLTITETETGEGRIYGLEWAKDRIVLSWSYERDVFGADTVHVSYSVKSTCKKRK